MFWKDASLHGTALLFISEKPMAAAQRSSNGCMGSCSLGDSSGELVGGELVTS